ncbi:MAG: T9SS type A sorting domain-containing protein [Flavobacteriales bacterium]|nr:T9SS type A sorting domain-containing protein [Flavobacteriales bacterium]
MSRILLTLTALLIFNISQAGKPNNLSFSSITDTSIILEWDEFTCQGVDYTLAYREINNTTWITINIPFASSINYSLLNLNPLTVYEWKVRCGGNWVVGSNFMTSDSISCNLNTYFTITNSTCDGLYDGSISVITSNGATPYTYQWSNNDTTPYLNNIPNDTYTLTTTDSLGCEKTDTILVGFNNLISLSQSVTPFVDTALINFPNIVQSHNLWVFDTLRLTNNGCDINIRPEFYISHQDTAIQSGQIHIQWKSPIGFITIPYNINIDGDAYGFWSTASNDSTGIISNMYSTNEIILRVKLINQAPIGTYTAIWNTKEVDNQGNIIQTLTSNDTIPLTLVDCNSLTPYLSYSDITCFGFDDGVATIDSISNGSGAYSYNWSDTLNPGIIIDTTNNILNLTKGMYICSITDDLFGCTIDNNISINEPDSLYVLETITNVSCNGDSSGICILDIIGGIIPYGQGFSGNSQYNLQAGIYTYTVTDNNGCLFTDTILISEPPLLTSTISSTNITNCSSPDGAIDITASGGTPGYTYNWDNGSTSEDLSNLSPGTYYVNISDTNNCSIIDSAIINDYTSLISTTLSSPTFNGYYIQCNGDNNGTINSSTSGSVGSLSYSWSNGQSTSTATNLFSGIHTLIVTDSLGCTATDSITLTEPAVLTSSYTQINVSCFGVNNGSAIVNFFGGTIGTLPGDTNYILGWDGLTTVLYNPISEFQTAAVSPSGIPAGVYPYSATDLNGCAVYDTITITEPDSLYTAYSTTNYNGFEISCHGLSDGEIDIQINGGTSPFNNYLNGVLQSSLITTGLSEGYYLDSIIDANGCIATNNITLNEPTDLISTVDSLSISCNGLCDGGITSSTYGGVLPYSYSWSNLQDTTADVLNLCAGLYTLTVSDANQCFENASATITEPNELTSSYIQTNISCFGVNDGSAIVNFFGGTIGSVPGDTNYILGWDGLTTVLYNPITEFQTAAVSPSGVPAGVYPYSATDLNGCTIFDTITITEPDSLYLNYSTTHFNGYEISCNGLNDGEIDIQVTGGTSPFNNYLNGTLQGGLISTNLVDGTYTDSIIDANGCTATTTIILTEPFELVSTLTSTNISCNGICDGEITSSTSGGVSPYSFAWSPQNQTTDTISNLCVGNYTLNVTDGNGCPENVSTTITEPYPINFTIDSTFDVSTYGGADGAIYITANGGSGLLTYSWTDPFTFTSTDADIDSLNASVYGLVITDSNSCVFDTLIEISQPSSLTLFLDSINTISCYDSCDASIFITASGGDSTYTYNWSGPNNFTATTADIYNLCDGEYILELSDSITTFIDTFNVYQPQPLSCILSADSILCHNGNTQAEINVWGGTQSFTYLWSNGDVNYITNLSSGNHSVIAVDQNGCSISNSITLSNPDSILAQTTTTNVSCNGFSDGSSTINVSSGGLTPYSYSNNGGLTYQSSNVFSNLLLGTYTYLISDFNGCLGSASAVINEPTQLTSITESDSISCYNECDGNVYATANGGTPPYAYNWGGSAGNLCAGNYNVTITDANGCLASNSVIVYEPNPLVINIWINGNAIEATSGFTTYQWYNANGTLIPGATSESFSPSSMDEYYVVVTDGICEESSYAIYYNVSGINNFNADFKIYPNPTQGMITIESNISFESISILNTIGNQLLLVENNNNDKGPTELDLSTFAKGIYFIQIEQNNQIMNYRIVLQ